VTVFAVIHVGLALLLPADVLRTRPAERGRLPRAFSAVVFTLPPVSLPLVCLPQVSLARLRGDLERTRVQRPVDVDQVRLFLAILAEQHFTDVVFDLADDFMKARFFATKEVRALHAKRFVDGDLQRPTDLLTERDDERLRFVVALRALHELLDLPLVHVLRHGAMMKVGDDNCLQLQYHIVFC